LSLVPAMVRCDGRQCSSTTPDPKAAGWITTSGAVLKGRIVLHDHRAIAGHYCSWNCFCGEPVRDL